MVLIPKDLLIFLHDNITKSYLQLFYSYYYCSRKGKTFKQCLKNIVIGYNLKREKIVY